MWYKVTIHGRSGKNGKGIVIMDISVPNSDVLSQNAYKIFDKKFILINLQNWDTESMYNRLSTVYVQFTLTNTLAVSDKEQLLEGNLAHSRGNMICFARSFSISAGAPWSPGIINTEGTSLTKDFPGLSDGNSSKQQVECISRSSPSAANSSKEAGRNESKEETARSETFTMR